MSAAARELRAGVSAVAVAGAHGLRAALIEGEPGVGKSTLALQLLAFGGRLVADDAVALEASGGRVIAAAPAGAEGRIEARGFGILRVPTAPPTPIALRVALIDRGRDRRREDLRRLPEIARRDLLTIGLPFIETTLSDALAPAVYCLLREGALVDPDAPAARSAEDAAAD